MREVIAPLGLSWILSFGCGDPKSLTESESATATTGATGDESSSGGVSVAGDACAPIAEMGGGDSQCGEGLRCCSDDPAATEGLLPAYRGMLLDASHGVPIFSETNNVLSYTGVCVPDEIVNPLLNGCATPCNPRWHPDEVNEVCMGGNCCQTALLGPKDCVLDPNTGRWRTLTGADILAGLTNWASAVSTPQDPTASSCQIFAGTNDANNELYADCIAQLTVADRRGLCAVACPCVEDTCELLNPDAVPRCN